MGPSMTFNNLARTGNRIPEIPQNRKHPKILEDDIEKPNKFLNTQQEKEWELTDCKRRVIIRVENGDFTEYIEDKSHVLTDDYVFKNPVNYEARVTGVKVKIFNATGIQPHRLDIIKVSISTKRAKLAWVTFTKAKSVNDIFRLAVINGNSTGFNAFPHVLAKAMKRRDAIEQILKRLQNENKALRYQIRLGDQDLTVWLKNHKEYDYVPYRKVEIQTIDPNQKVPDWELTTKDKDTEEVVNSNGKREASSSPIGKSAPKKLVNDWQLSEFIWAYLEGTQTKPQYDDKQWELEEAEDRTFENDEKEDDLQEEQEIVLFDD